MRRAESDLHVADTRYYIDCRKTFMGQRNIATASQKEKNTGFYSIK